MRAVEQGSVSGVVSDSHRLACTHVGEHVASGGPTGVSRGQIGSLCEAHYVTRSNPSIHTSAQLTLRTVDLCAISPVGGLNCDHGGSSELTGTPQ